MTGIDNRSREIGGDDVGLCLEWIACEELGVATPTTRSSDRLDDHDIAVWKLGATLRSAYHAARNSALRQQQQEERTPIMTTENITHAAIEANLAALADGLTRSSTLTDMARQAMAKGERNLAIGTVLPLEQELPTMTGLLTAVLALHRRAGQGGAP